MIFDNRIIAAMRSCNTKEQVEDTFYRFGVTDMQEKQRYLIYAMYAPAFFFSSTKPLTQRQIYECLICNFIQGSWRLTPLYEELGLSKKPLSMADGRMLEKLDTCTVQQDIDAVFEQEGIHSLPERCNILRRCMHIQEIVSETGTFSEQDDYDFDCAVFLEGSWRNM